MASPKNKLHSTIDINITKSADFEITDTRIIVYNVPITGEIVQKYNDGVAYKPADEIAKVLVDNVPITFLHPGVDVASMDTSLFAENAQGFLRKPTLDRKQTFSKTKLYADLVIFRTADTQSFEQALKSQRGIDVSIGFSYMLDPTPGTFDGKDYDYVQRNISLDHLAVLIDSMGIVYPGRAPFPSYGIGADSKNTTHKKMVDKTVSEELYTKAVADAEDLKTANKELAKKVTDMETAKSEQDAALTKANEDLAKVKTELDAQAEELKDFRAKKAADKADKIAKLKEKFPAMDSLFDTASDEALNKAFEDMQKTNKKNLSADAGAGTSASDKDDDAKALEKQGFNKPFKKGN